jgi:hypothetical protein
MADQSRKIIWCLSWLVIPAILTACSLFGSTGNQATQPVEATPTPTSVNGGAAASPTSEENPCEGLSGSLEMMILVGPSDAVGLEPVAVGDLPFSVVSEGRPYLVEGGGNLNYEDMLTAEWGTYTVTMDMLAEVSGECVPDGQGSLELNVTAQGEQLVEVEAEGFHGEYPWEGEQSLELAFPLEDGAQAQGEGWIFTLHLE